MIIGLILAVGFILRLISIDQSLWLDEAVTAKAVSAYKFFDIPKFFSPADFHPPLYYLLMKLWTNIFGYSEISLRMPSIIFSILTGYVVYLIGKRLKNRQVGVWAAVFFLFNPLIVYYSQEARMYMMTVFFLTMALYFFVRIINIGELNSNRMSKVKSQKSKAKVKSQKISKTLMFSIFIILGFYTFYGTVFLIVAMLVYLIFKRQYRELLVIGCWLFVAGLIISPLLYRQMVNSKQALATVSNWSLVLGKANLKNLLLIPLKFSFGRISFYPKGIYYLVSGLWSLFIFAVLLKAGLKNKLLLFLFVFPLILGLVFSFSSPLLQYFRFLFLLPIMSILLTLGTKDWQRWVIVFGFLILSLIYLFCPFFHREDWKSLARNISKDKPVYIILPSSDALSYYKKDLNFNDLREIVDKSITSKKIIVIPYTSDIYGLDYQKILREKGFKLNRISSAYFLQMEEWVR